MTETKRGVRWSCNLRFKNVFHWQNWYARTLILWPPPFEFTQTIFINSFCILVLIVLFLSNPSLKREKFRSFLSLLKARWRLLSLKRKKYIYSLLGNPKGWEKKSENICWKPRIAIENEKIEKLQGKFLKIDRLC